MHEPRDRLAADRLRVRRRLAARLRIGRREPLGVRGLQEVDVVARVHAQHRVEAVGIGSAHRPEAPRVDLTADALGPLGHLGGRYRSARVEHRSVRNVRAWASEATVSTERA